MDVRNCSGSKTGEKIMFSQYFYAAAYRFASKHMASLGDVRNEKSDAELALFMQSGYV